MDDLQNLVDEAMDHLIENGSMLCDTNAEQAIDLTSYDCSIENWYLANGASDAGMRLIEDAVAHWAKRRGW